MTMGASAVSVLGHVGRNAGAAQEVLDDAAAVGHGPAVRRQPAAVLLVLAGVVGAHRLHITGRSLFALLWAVVVLSIAAVLLMLWLLQRRAASQVTSLFFLTPALSAVEGADPVRRATRRAGAGRIGRFRLLGVAFVTRKAI